MVDVAFKDLCVDAVRPEVVGPFWAHLLGLAGEELPDGDHRLSGERPEQTVWVNRVPEAQQVKNRVHLDVRLEDPSLPGVPVVAQHERWSVRSDPEGLHFCAFAGGAVGAFELVVDAVDAGAIASWWAERTGATVCRQDGADFVWLEGAAGLPWDYWVFNPVPEPKTGKNRVHWDVRLVDADVDALVAAGATVLRRPDDEIRWTVMADPEGNEFCAFSGE